MTTYKIANIPFSITGNHPIVDVIKRDFYLLPNTKEKTNLNFKFVSEDILPKNYLQIENVYFNSDAIFIKDGSFNYRILGNPYSRNKVEILLKPNYNSMNPLFAKIFQIRNWNYLTKLEVLAKNFIYNIFDYIMHLRLLQYKRAFIHGSSLVKNSQGIMFLGWGGAGKTSLLIKVMYDEEGWRFLSDDLSILDENSIAYLNSKLLQIYAYNTKGNSKLLNRFLSNVSLFNKGNWYYKLYKHGPKGVRRRLSPEFIFGKENIANQGIITKVLFLQRASTSNFKIVNAKPKYIAEKSAHIIIEELNPFLKYSNILHSFGQKIDFPTSCEILQKSKEVYLNAFKSKECYFLFVPNEAGPSELHDFIKRYKLGIFE